MDFEDLEMVDTIVCQFINAIRSCEDDGLTSDQAFRGESLDRGQPLGSSTDLYS